MPRRKKDPDTPKRPLSSYMFYSKERRPTLQQEQPTLAFGDYSKIIAAEWKKMTTEDKEPYLALSQKDKQRYDEALKIYKEKKKNEPQPYEMGHMNKNFTTQDNINAHQQQMRQRAFQNQNYRVQYLQRQRLMQNPYQYFVPELSSGHLQQAQYMHGGGQPGQQYNFIQSSPQQQYGYYGNQLLQQDHEHQQPRREQNNVHPMNTAHASQQFNSQHMQMLNSISPQAQGYLYSQPIPQQHFGVQQHFPTQQHYMDERNHLSQGMVGMAQQKNSQVNYGVLDDSRKLPDPATPNTSKLDHHKEISDRTQFSLNPGNVMATATTTSYENMANTQASQKVNDFRNDLTAKKLTALSGNVGLPDVEGSHKPTAGSLGLEQKVDPNVVKSDELVHNNVTEHVFNDAVVPEGTE